MFLGTDPAPSSNPSSYLAEYSRNWPSDELLRDVGGLVVGVVLWLANFLYGGIHAAAWNDLFLSAVEKWLWRASASYIGFVVASG